MKLLLAKAGSLLLRGEVDWDKAELGGVWRLEVLEQSLDLRQVLQFEWVTVDGKSNVSISKNVAISEARLFVALGGSSALLKFLWGVSARPLECAFKIFHVTEL